LASLAEAEGVEESGAGFEAGAAGSGWEAAGSVAVATVGVAAVALRYYGFAATNALTLARKSGALSNFIFLAGIFIKFLAITSKVFLLTRFRSSVGAGA
jgi:hypothetical protein